MPDLQGRLDRGFYDRPTSLVAQDLLGQFVVTQREDGLTAGRIVETEAYLGAGDPASHAARLKRGPVEVMWGEPGVAYVYRSYGIHVMLNVVAKITGETGAVLIRALEPVEGLDLMRQRRGVEDERLLCSGPGKLCQALGIELDWQGTDLVSSERLWIAPGLPVSNIAVSGRIGISRGQEHQWRFWETANAHVSAHRRGSPLAV